MLRSSARGPSGWPDEHGSTGDTDTLIQEQGGKATFLKADLTTAQDMTAVVDEAVETFGRLGIWVNNAGIGLTGSISEETQEQFDKTYRVNVTGTWLGAQAAARVMKAAERKARGVAASSTSALLLARLVRGRGSPLTRARRAPGTPSRGSWRSNSLPSSSTSTRSRQGTF